MVKRVYKIVAYIFVCMLVSGLLFTSCKDDKENGEVILKSYGPSPALRGGELKFVGQNMDKVTSVVLPSNIAIAASAFKSVTSEAIIIDVPQEAVDGTVKLTTPSGDIIPKTIFSISQPISIASITPASVRPGDVVTIAGDYLNLVTEVVFSSKKSVLKAAFQSQSRTQIKVAVPADARTGKVVVSNGAADPILVESASDLTVTAPAFAATSAITPIPVRAGDSVLITGTNLDLATAVRFGGAKTVVKANFGKTPAPSATSFWVPVPADAQNGNLVLIAQSGVEITSATSLIMADPTNITTPATIKNNAIITVSGADVDLINKVTFGGGKDGAIQSGATKTQITVKVPADAVNGSISYGTKAGHTIAGSVYTLVVPTITSISPLTTAANGTITINGTDLDLVTTVVYTSPTGANYTANPSGNATQIQANVTPGAISGTITLVTTNKTNVTSSATTQSLTIVPNVPSITTVPAIAYLGAKVVISGTNLDLATEITFPGNLKATMFGAKTATTLEVFVPMTTTKGVGKIKFMTNLNEITYSPDINFKMLGPDPVADPALVFNDFESHNGHTMGWDNWGGAGTIAANDPAIALSGNYMTCTGTAVSGWNWIWGCNHDGLPKVAIANTADYVLKVDINITKPLASGGNFQIEFAGSRINIGMLGMLNGGSYSTNGWVTQTWDLSTLTGVPASIPASGEWGLILTSGTYDLTGLYLDNFRFEHK